jgi:GR25 family glycosyltransferase involved in LPS biosynthesis
MYPLILFAYNKSEPLLKTIRALEQNIGASETDLIFFCDGPKDADESSDSFKKVARVREIVKGTYAFKSTTIVESPVNKGLAASVIHGVSNTLKDNDAVIIIEDDVITSRHFLKFMNRELDRYKHNSSVSAIGSWNYFFPNAVKNFFFRIPDSIAWGVYKRSWLDFESDGNRLLKDIKESGRSQEFNVNGAYDYLNMLELQSHGKVDSWAIRWYASCFLRNKLTLYPGITLTKHIGYGDDATNCKDEVDTYRQTFGVEDNLPDDSAVKVIEVQNALDAFYAFHHQSASKKRNLASRIINLFR